MKIFELRDWFPKPFGIIGLLILGCILSCASDDQKLSLKEIPVPEYAFSLKNEVMAFQAEGKKGTSFAEKVDVRNLNQYVEQFNKLLVYEVDPNGKTQLLGHSFENGFLKAQFTAGNQYIIYAAAIDPQIINTYRALCRFGSASIIGGLETAVFDRLCLVILCRSDMLRVSDVILEIPEFAPLIDELNLPPELEFGGLDIKTRQIPTSANRGRNDLCDQCFGFSKNQIIPFAQCLPQEPLPSSIPPPKVALINMIPADDSEENTQNPEPFLAVNFSDPSYVAASYDGAGSAPIFVSEDSGQHWTYSYIVPSTDEYPVFGITIAASTNPGELFVGVYGWVSLYGDAFMKFFRTDDYTASTIMEERLLQTMVGQKPYVQSSPNPDQRVYIGNTKGRESIIYVSDDAGNNFTQNVLNFRGNNAARLSQPPYSPTVRPAISGDGTVYVTHLEASRGGSDLIIVRDDNGGVGDAPFQDLIDPSDNIAGKIVEKNIPNLHNRRIGLHETSAPRLSLAVHPSNSQILYVAWEDTGRLGDINGLHIKQSLDGGRTWSENLRYVRNAINPCLAVSKDGTLGFSYQAFSNGRWTTRLEQTKDAFDTRVNTILSSFSPTITPRQGTHGPLGEFMHLIAVDGEFWGVFSAINTPNEANFPNGVTYQRLADFSTQTLSDADGNPVEISVDPFFFRVSRIP